MAEPVLRVRGLCVDFLGADGRAVRALDGVSLDVAPGEVVGLAGESGSGKSTLAQAILRILPPPAVIRGGAVSLEGVDLLAASEEALRRLRWARVSMVFQSAMDALNPVLPVGEQLADAILAHRRIPAARARARAAELLDRVGVGGERCRAYPHQLSGGMRQRVGIAMALALEPALLILDEPTTALDVIVEREILGLVLELRRALGFAVLFISHDLHRMLQVADRVAVLYAARLAEVAPVAALRTDPRHPYTRGLLAAFPGLHGGAPPVSIPGSAPSLLAPPSGCRFHPRCGLADARCAEAAPALADLGGGRAVACWKAA